MNRAKLRAAILVFLVGFALGLSAFVASRMFVRAILSSDAIVAAENLAGQLAAGKPIQASGALSSVIRYSYLDTGGRIVASNSSEPIVSGKPLIAEGEVAALSSTGPIVEEASLMSSLLGQSAVRRVAVPVMEGEQRIGTLAAEVDQTAALDSLSRAFSVVAMVIVGLAVLAVVVVAFVVTRGRGFGNQKRPFDASALPRDPLTDVPTRSGLAAYLNDAIERAATADHQVGLMIAGLEGFRAVNDIWGHAIGDEVLRIAAERLKPFGPRPGQLARIGGDEFALVVEGESTSNMRHIANEVRAALCQPFEINGTSVTLGAGVGSALYPVNAESGDVLFRAADTALSKAKAIGRNAIAVFDTEMKEKMQRSATIERDLRQAMERNELVVFYQPQLELASGRLRGYEALVRWERPGEGMLSPDHFLAVAEETGLIREIGEWVLRKACQDAASWLDAGTVAVNFSAAQFRSQEIDKTIAQVLEETGLPPERLEIEVPEALFLHNSSVVMDLLSRVKALGVRVAMDNFGRDYSGLASLAHFPFDKVKIDRRFVGQLTEDADVASIVSAIVALGRTLSVDVTAEGVETSEQVTLLKAAGCSIVQGFLFGAPKREVAGSADIGNGENGATRPARTASA